MSTLAHPDIEAAAIGALLIDASNLHGITLENFSDQKNRTIFEAVLTIAGNAQVDVVLVADKLRSMGQLSGVGGMEALLTLIECAPPASSLARYAAVLRDAGDRRRLAEKSRQIEKFASDAESAADAIDQAEATIHELRRCNGGSGLTTVTEALTHYFRALEHRHSSGGGLIGTTTGFDELDRLTCGLQPGDLVLVAARPSMGKTALAMGFAEAAARSGQQAVVFSLEMGRDQLMQRLISSRAKVDAQRLRTGVLLDSDWSKITKAAASLKELPLLIDDSSNATVMDIRARARQAAKEKPLGLIVVDYVGLVRPVKAQQTREREIAEISRSLKALAKELGTAVVVACQLNRALESGAQPRKPVMSDLRESGALEQDADVVLFPWREAALCPDCRTRNADCGKGHFRAAEIIIGKQRNGPIGTIPVAWLPEFTSFAPLQRHNTESYLAQTATGPESDDVPSFNF